MISVKNFLNTSKNVLTNTGKCKNFLLNPSFQGSERNIKELSKIVNSRTSSIARKERVLYGLRASLYSIASIVSSVVGSVFYGIAYFVENCKEKKYIKALLAPLVIPATAISGTGYATFLLAKSVYLTARAIIQPHSATNSSQDRLIQIPH